MRNLENNWQTKVDSQYLSYGLLGAIAKATKNVDEKYWENMPWRGLTYGWVNHALAGVLTYIEQENPTIEQLRRDLYTVRKVGKPISADCTEEELTRVLDDKKTTGAVNPNYGIIRVAHDTHKASILGNRHFGDAQVLEPSDRSDHISYIDRMRLVAWSGGCNKPIYLLEEIKRNHTTLPSLPWQGQVVPELNRLFQNLDAPLATHIWDYVRINKTCQVLMDIISNENQPLFNDIMNKRQLITDPILERGSVPRPVKGDRLVGLLGLPELYELSFYPWKNFDATCAKSPLLAEQSFDQDMVRITSAIVAQVPTLDKLAATFSINE